MTLPQVYDDEDALDAVGCAHCGTIFDARGTPADMNGEHVCGPCRMQAWHQRTTFIEMDVWYETS